MVISSENSIDFGGCSQIEFELLFESHFFLMGSDESTANTPAATTAAPAQPPIEHDTDSSDDAQLQQIEQKQKSQIRLNFEMKKAEFLKLRNANTEADAKAAMDHLGNCVNGVNPENAKKYCGTGISAKICFVVVNTYVTPKYQLGVGPLNDAITVAVNHKKMGYKMLYLHNSNPTEFKKWLQFLLENTTNDLTIFYTGHGCSVRDKTGDESDGYDEVMLFDSGYVLDDVLADYLVRYAKGGEQRIVLLSDCCHSGSIWDIQSILNKSKAGNKIPSHIVSISAAQDNQTAKQTKVDSKDQGIFTYFFWDIWQDKQDITFKDMEKQINPKIGKFTQLFTVATTTPSMLEGPIFPDRERPPRRPRRPRQQRQ